MASVNTYLNFSDQTEEVFNYYKTIFGGEFAGDGFSRFGDIPPSDDMPAIPESDKDLIMHVELPILGGHSLMGCDAPASMGFKLNKGNNVHISIQMDSREETDALFSKLASDGVITMPLAEMFWGDYFGSCTDRYGIQWMLNCAAK
ncbi:MULTISPECIES: VOC family protein [Reichenbachiella]|uniref:PhnB protein n=1 Tax=Reichenbachiella agariperforans TaxID=156994 RepID=A0A1M6JVU6_REIAG|nr:MULTISPECIES: VOC family protein [Reichenbachiella]MBU2913320.1 VOC family protein [Reichenbachiella agariperforans]RJE74693.1 glyoxalase [Reichenbachiella sp. MSK19-1]SHJ50772.1 PhnB protein [Reichenbachiella agariperforans]